MESCAACDLDLVPTPQGEAREPCPRCGSSARVIEKAATVAARAHVSVDAVARRGANDARVAALALIAGAGLAFGPSVGFETGSVALGVIVGLGAAVAAAGLLALVYRVEGPRHTVMGLMHRITGQ